MITSQAVGENIRRIRVANNLTQKALALRLGYKSLQFVSDVERGNFFPKLVTLNKFASALGCSVDNFLANQLSSNTESLGSEAVPPLDQANSERISQPAEVLRSKHEGGAA
jgi:transcriptional regulator with XRE-family HTH domain